MRNLLAICALCLCTIFNVQANPNNEVFKDGQITGTVMDDALNEPLPYINIVVKNLEPLAITDRPVHAINKDEWFVNDEKDGWEGNKPDKVIDATRHGIRSKWPDVFEEQHPQWINNEKLKTTYVELAGMATADLSDREKSSIRKTIGKNCSRK